MSVLYYLEIDSIDANNSDLDSMKYRKRVDND